jgi:hypothetical protein
VQPENTPADAQSSQVPPGADWFKVTVVGPEATQSQSGTIQPSPIERFEIVQAAPSEPAPDVQIPQQNMAKNSAVRQATLAPAVAVQIRQENAATKKVGEPAPLAQSVRLQAVQENVAKNTVPEPAPLAPGVTVQAVQESMAKKTIPEPDPPAPADAVQAPQRSAPRDTKPAPLTTLAGYVQQYRNTWRLRYAAIDQEDPFGGVVILDGCAESTNLQEGQRARVIGTLVPPQSRNGSAHLHVQSIELFD